MTPDFGPSTEPVSRQEPLASRSRLRLVFAPVMLVKLSEMLDSLLKFQVSLSKIKFFLSRRGAENPLSFFAECSRLTRLEFFLGLQLRDVSLQADVGR